MKKFHDIHNRPKTYLRIRKVVKSKPGFWEGTEELIGDSQKIRSKRVFSLSGRRVKGSFFRAFFITGILLFFFGFTLVKAMGTKEEIEKLSTNAKNNLSTTIEAIDNGDLPSAMKSAEKARSDVKKIKLLTQSWGQDIKYFSMISPGSSKTVSLERFLNASDLVLDSVSDIQTNMGGLIKSDGGSVENTSYIFDISGKADKFAEVYKKSDDKLSQSLDLLAQIDKRSASGLGIDLEKTRSSIIGLKQSLTSSNEIISKDLLWLCAKNSEDRKILIIFQNNAELRGGSAGSLGSFGVAKFSEGKLKSIDFGKNIFKLDKDFKAKESITPPEDIAWVMADKKWAMKDSGWAVDSRESMEKIEWFYEKESGESVDGTIIIDTTAFLDLLKFTGPIEMKAYGKTITYENFRTEVEYEVHKGYFQRDGNMTENEPKKILSDLMPIFMNRLFGSLSDETKAFGLMSVMKNSLAKKDILLYFSNPDFQKRMEEFNYSGKVRNSSGDYLYINNSNVDGFKSSLNIDEKINLVSNLASDGKVYNQLEITREHKGTNDWPDGRNRNFVRVLLPDYSLEKFEPLVGDFQLFGDFGLKDGKEYWQAEEAGHKTLNFWLTTEAGKTSEAKISYLFMPAIDMSKDFSYQIVFQKQPGANADKISYQLNFPKGYLPTNVTNYDAKSNSIKIDLTLDRDKNFVIKFKKL